jgi:hypothetical protein
LGQRSRKKGQRARPAPKPKATTVTVQPELSRSARKNAEARATLEPFAPGERPWPIVVSAVIACALALVTLGFYAAGTRPSLGGTKPSFASVIPYSVIMLACGIGTWMMRYWAVLGFQTLLAIGLLGASLALIKVNSVWWGIAVVVVIAAAAYLFWKLVRVLGRIQMPTRSTR